MVATDGHRLAHIEKTGETLTNISGEKKTLIPRKALAELQSLLSDTEEESLDFFDDEHTLFFRLGHRVLTTRKLTGQFPNYEAVLPRRQQQVRCGAQRRIDGFDSARRAICRRAVRRHQDPVGAERNEDLVLLY